MAINYPTHLDYEGAVAYGVSSFPLKNCVCFNLQAVYQLSGPVYKSTWRYFTSVLLLTSISRFVIDFLSIWKVIMFFSISADDRHPPKSVHCAGWGKQRKQAEASVDVPYPPLQIVNSIPFCLFSLNLYPLSAPFLNPLSSPSPPSPSFSSDQFFVLLR